MNASTFLLCLLLSVGLHAQPSTKADRIRAVENGLIPYVPVAGFPSWKLADRMRYHGIPGASVAVIRNYQIDWVKAYGLADTTKKTPVTTETLFSTGSISKLVTAVLALRLVEQGKLALDSPINNYLRSWKLRENEWTAKRPVTLRLLLSHTAGTSQSAYFGYLPTKSPLPTVVQVLRGDSLAEVNPVVVNSEPGKEFRYSGGGYLVVQQAIMDVTGQDFARFAREELFEPLGMKHSSFEQPLPPALAAKAAWGYSAAAWYQGMPYVYPQQAAAGLYSTATDLALLLIELQKCLDGKGRYLRKATVADMLRPVVTISDGTYREEMGLGAFLLQRTDNRLAEGRYFEHQGANAGFIAFAMGSIKGGNGVVILLNSGDDFNAFGTELRRSVARVYRWPNFLPATLEPVRLDAGTLDAYAGRYRKGPDEVITLRRENDYLVETINGGKAIYCFPVGRDSIVFTDYNIRGFFGRDREGRVVSLRNQYQSEEQAMPRMREDELTPSEHLKAKRYTDAKEGFRSMRLNEYQVTYLAYDWLNRKPMDPEAVKALLEVALEQHPNSAIVFSRWGDYYKAIGDRKRAAEQYRRSLELEPGNKEVLKSLGQLK